ncbi:hypothetical protein A5662_09815 [Mycobacteriaceae bacterium 1482268.1]|nr:hypothetical protein A5662_09815 [Mycobacteriaceae bacterium 1482268.1]
MTSSVESTHSALRSIFDLYAALDRVVIAALQSDQPELATVVDQYLPGASANAGWSQDIARLFELPPHPELGTDDDDISAAVDVALNALMTRSEEDDPLTIPDQKNLVYVVGALMHISAIEPIEKESLFKQVLELASPTDAPMATKSANAGNLYELLLSDFLGMAAWDEVIDFAAQQGWVKKAISKVPNCRTGVVTVNGYECVFIDADLESDTITFNDLIDAIDPQNWPMSYPSFFCSMDEFKDRGDEWFNLREVAGFCKISGGYKLRTRLKFIKSKQKDLDHRLDFDLAEEQGPGCDELVKVDRGFVNATCNNLARKPELGGVKLRTRKVAHVVGISPYAQAFLLCKLGYGWAAVQTFFGPVADGPPPPGYTKWGRHPVRVENPNIPGPGGSSGSGAQSGGAGGPTQSDGSQTSGAKLQVSTKTAKALAEMANYLTATNLDITKKWLAGQLHFEDLAKYSQEVGAKLASEPWKWLKDITTDTAGNGGSSGGSGGSTP